MKLSRFFLIAILPFTLLGIASAAPGKEKEKETPGQVDSGSFGIFMNGRRVGTETFSITQSTNGSVIRSEVKAEGSAGDAVQSSEMQLTTHGEIRRYDWKEISPGKAQSVILPNEEFLSQKWSAGPQEKPKEQSYLLPPSTSILDDYFFIHREVLAWKYLVSICSQQNGQLVCTGKQLAKFGTLNPRQHTSDPASLEFLTREKVTFKGVEQELNKLELKSEAGTWTLWLNDQFKVVRILIPSDNYEVVRD